MRYLLRQGKLSSILLLASIVLLGFAFPPLATAQKRFAITHRWLLGGKGSWDYIIFDPPSKRLYIAHQTQVDVIAIHSVEARDASSARQKMQEHLEASLKRYGPPK